MHFKKLDIKLFGISLLVKASLIKLSLVGLGIHQMGNLFLQLKISFENQNELWYYVQMSNNEKELIKILDFKSASIHPLPFFLGRFLFWIVWFFRCSKESVYQCIRVYGQHFDKDLGFTSEVSLHLTLSAFFDSDQFLIFWKFIMN